MHGYESREAFLIEIQLLSMYVLKMVAAIEIFISGNMNVITVIVMFI
jgi:hypothetical protein